LANPDDFVLDLAVGEPVVVTENGCASVVCKRLAHTDPNPAAYQLSELWYYQLVALLARAALGPDQLVVARSGERWLFGSAT
jgi:hypothetical protein